MFGEFSRADRDPPSTTGNLEEMDPYLVGALEHLDYFPYIGNNHPK